MILQRALLPIIGMLVAALLYQGHRLGIVTRAGRSLEQDLAQRQEEIRQRTAECAQADARRAALDPALQAAEARLVYAGGNAGLDSWLKRVDMLKDWLRANPERLIPEMRYLNSNDWLSVTLDNRLETDAERRVALRKLRHLAKNKPEVSRNLARAVRAYARDHDGRPVTDPRQLQPYLDPGFGDEILGRYEPVPEIAGENDRTTVRLDGAEFRGMGRIVLQEKTPADEDYDTRLFFAEQGMGSTGVSRIGRAVTDATLAFSKANPGQQPSHVEQLLPYLTSPIDEQSLREYWKVKDWK